MERGTTRSGPGRVEASPSRPPASQAASPPSLKSFASPSTGLLNPRVLTPADVLALQRIMGNRYVMRMLAQSTPPNPPSAGPALQSQTVPTGLPNDGLSDVAGRSAAMSSDLVGYEKEAVALAEQHQRAGKGAIAQGRHGHKDFPI